MTVSVPVSTAFEYEADGLNREFSFPLLFLESADVQVYVDGVDQTLGVHYAIEGAGEPLGGTVTFEEDQVPAAGAVVRLIRSTAPKQTVDFEDNVRVPGNTLERQLDRLAMSAQDQRTAIDLVLSYAVDLEGAIAQAAYSAAAAASSAAATLAMVETFGDSWLGARASAPLTDTDGSALEEGDLYWDISTKQFGAWDATGLQWVYLESGGMASLVSFVPTGGLSSTNVQAALAELDSEKQALNSNLTAIAALTTTAFGRSVLDRANAAALATLAGVGTGNSPQFAGIELGHASDTTLSRSAAGRLSVEGNPILLGNTEDQIVAGGARVTVKDLGNLSGATVTPDPGDRPIQKVTNNGAGSILPGANEGQYTLQVINATGAGVITTTGWTTKGDSFDTTTASKFLCSCLVTSDIKLMTIVKVA